jgi:hypothetical protein
MKFFSYGTDGGEKSGVTGFWLCEIKSLFSIVILHFSEGTRENYHSHAFNAYTWFLWGAVEEQHKGGEAIRWGPSIWPKWTPRECFHRVKALTDTWAISFRGPWNNTWQEYNPHTHQSIKLSHGRVVVDTKEE